MRLIHRFILRLVPLGALAAVIGILVSSSGPIPSERFQNINLYAGPGENYSAGTFDSLLSAQKKAGIGQVREVLDWSQIETTEGTYNWSTPIPYAAVFASEKAQDLKVIAVLTGGPTYMSDTFNSTQFLLRWADFVQAAVDQFGSNVNVWEIGSQINTSTGMSAFLVPAQASTKTTPDPKLYTQMLKVADKIIKDADPNDEVWMGSLVSSSASNCGMNPLTFLLEINGNKGWNSFDSLVYNPKRGAVAPEAADTETSSACASSLPVNNTTLAGEVQSVQDLARQLGGKPLQIEGLTWSSKQLSTLASDRAITSDQALADYLTRATVQLAGNNSLTNFSWQVDQKSTPAAFTALSNLNSILDGAKFMSEPQGQSGSVFEYRFSKGSQWIIIAWHAQDGDNPVPIQLSGLQVSSLTAYPVDAAGFTSSNGTDIPVDGDGNATVMVNERPVIFLGKTNNLASALQQDGSAQTDQWKYQMKVTAHRWTNQLKADMLHVVENLFESAKDKAINWGEEKLNNILG